MKIERLKKRLDKNRPMSAVTIRMPEDVVEDLKRIAPRLGFSGYQPLMRAYIGTRASCRFGTIGKQYS